MSVAGSRWIAGEQSHACAAKQLLHNKPQESIVL